MLQRRNILIDQGNTYCKLCIVDDGIFKDQTLYKTLPKEVLMDICNVPKDVILSVIFCAVGKLESYNLDFLRERANFFLELNENTPLPIDIASYPRNQLGADRIAVIVGAYSKLEEKQEVLIIDIGTAITYERISKEGKFLGGNISPGPKTRLLSLHKETARLPLVDMPFEENVEIGNTTVSAISCGVNKGVVFEINGYIAELKEKYPQSKVFLTGGYGIYFVNQLKSVNFVVPNLVMIGLNRILENYVCTIQKKS